MNCIREFSISYFDFTVMFGDKTTGSYDIAAHLRHTPILYTANILNKPIASMGVDQLAKIINNISSDKISLECKREVRNVLELIVEYDSLCDKPVVYIIELINYSVNTDEWMETHGFDKIKKQYIDLKAKYDDLVANVNITRIAMDRYMELHK